jgi:hypothetical protein
MSSPRTVAVRLYAACRDEDLAPDSSALAVRDVLDAHSESASDER